MEELSGGELQRFAIATAAGKEADVYMFDEPSSYLDVRQRLEAARLIRELSNDNKWVLNCQLVYKLGMISITVGYNCKQISSLCKKLCSEKILTLKLTKQKF